jgi:hypothetical protein
MATVKLGAFVTGIAGSIQGTTFRRNRGNVIMQSNPRGGSNSKLLQNKNLIQIAGLGQIWNALTPVERSNWYDLAQTYPQSDKWGNVRTLTAREMFYKLSGSLIPVGLPPPVPNAADNTLPTITIVAPATSGAAAYNITFSESIGAGSLLFQVNKVRSTATSFTFTRRKISKVLPFPIDGVINCIDAITSVYPSLKVGDFFHVYFRVMNVYGFRGVYTARTLEIV